MVSGACRYTTGFVYQGLLVTASGLLVIACDAGTMCHHVSLSYSNSFICYHMKLLPDHHY